MMNNNGIITITIRHHLQHPAVPFEVSVSPNDTIWQLKRQIQFHANVQTQAVRIRLHYGGMVLRNQSTIRECGIVRNAVVQWTSNQFMTINVTNHYDSTQFKVHVQPSTTVTELKSLIDAKMSGEYLFPFMYKVYFCGLEVNVDSFNVNQPISEFGIMNSDVNLDLLLHFSPDSMVDDEWTLKVRREQGTFQLVQLKVQDLVHHVKTVIQQRLNIPRTEMPMLVYEGKTLLANRRRLTMYLVQRTGCLYLDNPLIRQGNMRVDVKVIGGRVLSFNVDRSTTVGELKALISDAQGTPTGSQMIYQVLNRFVNDALTLADYHVNEGCLLYMDYSLMHLYVTSDAGDTVVIWVTPQHFVLEVKSMIFQAHSGMFPTEDMVLILDGTVLQDYEMLRSYPIYGGMTLLSTDDA